MIRVHCPVCDRVMEGQSRAEWPEFPFCSARCRTIDLGRWLGEKYRIGVPEAEGKAPDAGSEEEEVP
jgi:endogenous inhibitor of DNA gyrase (YacG/DUF329 family)